MKPGLPPSPGELAHRALLDSWPTGTRIHRAHPHLYGSAQCDVRPNADSRFSTIRFSGSVIPVLYGGENDQTAASETIFHSVDTPTGSALPRKVPLMRYVSWQWSEVVTVRELHLIRLDDDGLEALNTSRADLIEGGRPTYTTTRAWAEALADAVPTSDGLWWMSRQDPGHRAVMLFGEVAGRDGGIANGDLDADSPALPFALPQGLNRLNEIGDLLDITIDRP